MPFWYAVLVSVLFIVSGLSWILFGRLTMGRIEKDIRKENLELSARWDALGYRIFGFARAVVFSERRLPGKNEVMVDATLIRRFANPRDRLLGIIFMVSVYSLLVVVLFGVFLFDL
ncbi:MULTISPECIES: hypothetical protein [Marinobacter]|uniref:hypothetical protein n=1 Tax=Marinobacter TaxID=2742 RepID=UPI001D08B1B6|nr:MULTISPECIES: hypothetical protein [Marinobacter]MCK7568169.1 hypothetical protein [Marinobacter xestospongiae]UDL06130.1 hypothetical protein J2887_05055 [Marinobacter sp. CA1]